MMAERHGEEAPLLGCLPSPSHTMSPPMSPAPVHTPSTLQVPSLVGAKTPQTQTSMDSGCESDSGDVEQLTGCDQTSSPSCSSPSSGVAPSCRTTLTTVIIQHGNTPVSIPPITTVPSDTCDSSTFLRSPSSRSNSTSDATNCDPVVFSSSSVEQFSPLSPNQPGGEVDSELSSPGPSGLCAPVNCVIVCSDDDVKTPNNTENNFPSIVRHTSTSSDSGDTIGNPYLDDGSSIKPSVLKYTTTNFTVNEDVREKARREGVNQEPSTKVTFRIEGGEGEEGDADNSRFYLSPHRIVEIQPAPLTRISSGNKSSFLSTSSSTTSMPFCRICHLPEGDAGVETLISPCRCAGTMMYIHHGCLMKWLEVSSSRSRQVPACELCNYQYHRRKKFRLRQCQLPSCSPLDKVLHSVFLACLLVMFACAAVTVICFKQNSNPRVSREDTELTHSEMVTLTCGVLFFAAFFVAMYVEVKATDTLYRLCTSFFYINQTMHIYEYDRKRDPLHCNSSSKAPV